MDSKPHFQYGNKVFFIPDIIAARRASEDGVVDAKDLPVRSVLDPYVQTTQKRIDGTPVNFYVKLDDNGNYHQQNLIRSDCYNSEDDYTGV